MFKLTPPTKKFLQRLVMEMAVIVCLGVALGLAFNQLRSSATRVNLLNTGAAAAEDLSPEAVMRELIGLNPITPDLAYAKMQAKTVVFVDARHPAEYARGHIKGAVNLPYENFMDYFEEFLNTHAPETILIVYCDGKNCEQSEHLGRELVYAGYATVYYMEPNWLSWLNSGKPVTLPKR